MSNIETQINNILSPVYIFLGEMLIKVNNNVLLTNKELEKINYILINNSQMNYNNIINDLINIIIQINHNNYNNYKYNNNLEQKKKALNDFTNFYIHNLN